MTDSESISTLHIKPFWMPWKAGLALGFVLLLTFVLTGHGLGATGASTKLAASIGLVLVAIFYFGSWFERRSSGPVTAPQAVAGAISDD